MKQVKTFEASQKRLSGPAGGFRIIAIRVLLVETARLLGLTFFCGWGSTQMKHNRDPESKPNCKLHKANSCGSLQSIPDLVSTFILTDLTGSSSRPKNPSKTCAPQGPPLPSTVAGVSFSTFVRLQATEHCCCRCP